MSLKLQITRTGINTVGTEMYLADATGDYHVDDNPGGWGAPNPERNTKSILVQSFLQKSDGPVDVEVTGYDPLTVTQFILNTKEDGYYETLAIAVDNVDPTVEDAYGWSSLNGLTQLKDGVLVAKTVNEVYDDPLFLDGVSYKTILLARMAIYRNKKNLELVQLRSVNNEDAGHVRELADAIDHFSYVKSLLDGAWYLWCADNYTGSQKIVESFDNVLDE